mgnify:CR=1 FL=1
MNRTRRREPGPRRIDVVERILDVRPFDAAERLVVADEPTQGVDRTGRAAPCVVALVTGVGHLAQSPGDDRLGEQLATMHMVQHLLLGMLGPLALVTGAGSGIGRASAHALLADGAAPAIVYPAKLRPIAAANGSALVEPAASTPSHKSGTPSKRSEGCRTCPPNSNSSSRPPSKNNRVYDAIG